MEVRLQRVEGEVVEIRRDVSDVSGRVLLLEDRQARLSRDIEALTTALEANTAAINKVTTIAAKRGAFVAGAVAVVGILVTAAGTALTFLKDWLFS